MKKTLRILLADDHDVVRRGLRALLETRPEWEICGEASTGREAVQKAREMAPDIVVMDVSMPELNGLEATRQILKLSPRSTVLVLTVHESEALVREMLEAGARGYMLKSDLGPELVTAVQTLSQGKPFFTSKVADLVLEGFRGRDAKPAARSPAGRHLTSREREIVQLIAEGRSTKEVASTLGISVKTAETHRTNIMRKLNLHSVSELVRYAIRQKMVEP
ncbi:MAG TPA: response regulator transcription factor [Candidatus Xenobia bacterium]|nr:response regulator transcription factor [Candidatus Xenobia bacterium]